LKYNKRGEPLQLNITCNGIQRNNKEAVLLDDSGEEFYLIKVKDNDIGFDLTDSERIFRLFQRLHGKVEYEGTGRPYDYSTGRR
jgi:light-regulated signal transduction histidine kinase (bacteriophytochrome)